MTAPSEQLADVTVTRGRWRLEWDSENGRNYVLHDARLPTANPQTTKLSYEEMADLRFVLAAVSEVRKRDLLMRNSKEQDDGSK